MGIFNSLIDLGEALHDLARDQSAWSQRTFGTDAERGPIGALKHLQKEAKEAEQACIMNAGPGGDRGIIAEEMADCLLLLLDASRRAGFTPLELLRAAEQKMAINKARVWLKTVGDVPTEHVREINTGIAHPIAITPGIFLHDYYPLGTTAERLGLAPGDTVAVRTDSGALLSFTVSDAPWLMAGGTWALGLDGIAGGYLLERVVGKRKQ